MVEEREAAQAEREVEVGWRMEEGKELLGRVCLLGKVDAANMLLCSVVTALNRVVTSRKKYLPALQVPQNCKTFHPCLNQVS